MVRLKLTSKRSKETLIYIYTMIAGPAVFTELATVSQTVCVCVCVCVKLQALVYDILPLEEGAGKRCSECVCVCVCV